MREPVDLSALIPTVVGEMGLRAEKEGVALVPDIMPDLPVLSADAAGLHMLLVNLLDNALQYTKPGGSITISARATGPQPGAEIQVADTGSGIAAEDLPRIFERFYRADKARGRGTTVTSSGAGLGLAIVRSIVEAHGGTISAESSPGQGTTITIRLPA